MKHTASMIWTLYKKDLRQMRGIALALVGYGVVVHALYAALYYLPRLDVMPYSSFQFRLRDLAVAIPYIFPTLLAYIIYQNYRDESRYQAFSLPLWRSTQIITAYFALMTYVLLYSMISQLISASWYAVQLYNIDNSFMVSVNASGQDITMNIFEVVRNNFAPMFWDESYLISNLSGIVCLAAGIASPLMVKNRGWYWTGFVAVVLSIYSIPDIITRFGMEFIPSWWLQSYVMPGLVFVAIGAYLYQRYTEA